MKNTFILLLVLMNAAAYGQMMSVPAYIPKTGLIAWFPFTGNAIDSSGHGHNGTVYGATMTYDRYGRPNSAYSFDGTSNYIYVPPGTPGYDISTDITASLTISAWVKSYNYFFTSQEQIYWRGDATPAHDPHMLYINGSQIRLRRDVNPGTTSNEVGYSITGLDTNFHLFTGTYDSASGYMCIYVDGMLKNKQYLPGLETYPTSTMYNYIGAVDGGTWQFFYGTIDELALWDRALTPCEVTALYYSIPDLVTKQPVNDTLNTGGTATFTITDAVPSATYQWQENAGPGFVNLTNTPPYSGVFTNTLSISPVTLALSGNSYRCIPAADSCLNDSSASAKLVVRTLIPSCILRVNDKSAISIIPNPNNGTFMISGQRKDNNGLDIEISDVLGQIVYSEKITPQNGQINKQVVLNSALSNGIYLLRIKSDNENTVVRIMKNN